MRVLLFQSDSDARSFNAVASVVPVLAFEGTYSANEIPYPVYFSKRECITGNERIIEAGEYFIAFGLMKLVRVESSGNGSLLYMFDGTHWQCENKLDFFEEKLRGVEFFRIHNCHLVNLACMERMVSCSAFVTLGNNTSLPVDPGKDKEIMEYLENRKFI